jgi:hypothetical protein
MIQARYPFASIMLFPSASILQASLPPKQLSTNLICLLLTSKASCQCRTDNAHTPDPDMSCGAKTPSDLKAVRLAPYSLKAAKPTTAAKTKRPGRSSKRWQSTIDRMPSRTRGRSRVTRARWNLTPTFSLRRCLVVTSRDDVNASS